MRPTGRGFPLAELLRAIRIIAVWIGRLLPAVQAAREASRRTQCEDDLKRLGLVLNRSVTSMDAFPIGDIAWSAPPGGAAPGWARSAAILPQSGQGSERRAGRPDPLQGEMR